MYNYSEEFWGTKDSLTSVQKICLPWIPVVYKIKLSIQLGVPNPNDIECYIDEKSLLGDWNYHDESM